MKKAIFIKIGLFGGDLLITQLALFLALFFRNHQLIYQLPYFFYRFIVLYLIWLLVLFILNLYDLHFFAKPFDFIINIGIFFVSAIFLSATYFYFITPSFAPKTILLLHLFIFSIIFYSWRRAVNALLQTYFFVHANGQDLYEKAYKKIPLDTLDVTRLKKKDSLLSIFIKRTIDVLVAILGLLVVAMLFPIIALAIVLDSPGGIFFRQARVGKNGQTFFIYKFRSMQIENNQQELWREKNKQSITRVGKILRRLHLDELPQAWSILTGELSFIGPRPEWDELARIFEKEIPFYQYRYLVKPGIIGWAQVNFPPSQSVAEAREKFEYDLYYIKHQSLLLDLEIMFKAVKLFFF